MNKETKKSKILKEFEKHCVQGILYDDLIKKIYIACNRSNKHTTIKHIQNTLNTNYVLEKNNVIINWSKK